MSRENLPEEIRVLIGQCEVGFSSFDNDDMSRALWFCERAAVLIERIDQALRVPAAEYVPAITDVFNLIDEFKTAARSNQ